MMTVQIMEEMTMIMILGADSSNKDAIREDSKCCASINNYIIQFLSLKKNRDRFCLLCKEKKIIQIYSNYLKERIHVTGRKCKFFDKNNNIIFYN